MNVHVERGRLLLQQSRCEEAIGELRKSLADDGEDPHVHALLSLAHRELGQLDEATQHAREAIGHAPDDPFGHYALALALLKRNRFDDAENAIDEALALQPFDADCFAALAAILFAKRNWRGALDAANRGLDVDAEHVSCANLRAQALVMLGDKAGAAATIEGALARRPDDASTHANQGWALLHQGQPRQAAEHFREALRLDPTSDWARGGMLEALKARNVVYRGLLAYFLWMARLPGGVRWGIVLGGFFGQRVVADLATGNPNWAPALWTVFYVYLAFALMTWIGPALFNLLMRFDRFGRHLLDRDDRRGAEWLAGCLGFAALVLLGAWLADSVVMRIGALYCALISIPLTAVFHCPQGWPRITMAVCTAVLAALALAVCVPLDRLPENLVTAILSLFAIASLKVFTWGLIGSQFLANYLIGVQPKR